MLLGLTALVLLLDGVAARARPVRRAAAIGWGFGFGQVVGMHWIFYPFLVDPLEHAWQIPFVAILFPAASPCSRRRPAPRRWRRGVRAGRAFSSSPPAMPRPNGCAAMS